ncbi:MAG: hypothetical protein K2P94_03595 [Rhodospirillaceae bacterium]|nr:hypothetical protein [Rhodospirillaceae bacterium]
MSFDQEKLAQRLDRIHIRRMRELLIALNEAKGKFIADAGGPGHGGEDIALALRAEAKTKDILTEQARKYLNYCAATSTDPATHINIFASAGAKFIEEVKQSQASQRRAGAAFRGAAGAEATFEREFKSTANFLEELIEDVRMGEIGIENVYRHPSAIERHWKSWAKDVLVAVVGGIAGGVIGFLSAGG